MPFETRTIKPYMTSPTQTLAAVPPSPTARWTRTLAVGSLLALIVLGLGWELWWAPLREGGSWWAIKVLPLTIPLAGLLKNRMYTYRWLSLMVWLYFTEGVMRATTESGLSSALAWGQVVLCVSLFTACALHVRLRLKAAAAQNETTDTANSAGQ